MYSVFFTNAGWVIRQNDGQSAGNYAYASREAALEVAYAAASNDI
jgi:hypothetical protein